MTITSTKAVCGRASHCFIVISLFILQFTHLRADSQINSLHGTVRDKASGVALPGVLIYIEELKRGAISSHSGSFQIEHLPAARVHVRISMLGYKSINDLVNIDSTVHREYVMEESIVETQEVVVTGLSTTTEKKRMPVPVAVVSESDLKSTAATTIVESIAQQPGVSLVSTGAAIAKPVIRGLGFNRVVVVSDGVRQEGQQWGDEHGLEVDANDVQSAEIIKGPASLVVGSDAMAGVVTLLSAQTLPEGKITTTADVRTQTNNGERSVSLNSAAHLAGWMWDLRYSHTDAHAYKNAYDGFVANSSYSQNSLHGVVGLNGSWGYSHLTISNFQQRPGIIEGERDSSGSFVKQERVNDTTIITRTLTSADDASRQALVPFQEIRHSKVIWENNLYFAESNLKAVIGWQQNDRKEFADVLHIDVPGIWMRLNTINYDVAYTLSREQSSEYKTGVNGMWQSSANKGTEFLIPDYQLVDVGAYVIGRLSHGPWEVAGGVRFDRRWQSADPLWVDGLGRPTSSTDSTATQRFSSRQSEFLGLSGSVGCSYEWTDELNLKLNLSRGFRAPNITELSANGVHDGTTRYEIGNPNLNSETSIQTDLGLSYHIDHVSAELSVFYNDIANFIFSHKLADARGQDSLREGYPTFMFGAGHAQLYGAELIVDIHPHPLDWLHVENSLAMVYTHVLHQPDSMSSLPMTPAPVVRSSLKAQFARVNSSIENLYTSVGVEWTMAQTSIFSAYATETSTPAYWLLNASVGSEFRLSEKIKLLLRLNATNLLDASYQSHLSRLKYTPENLSTGRVGVFNMGRSFALSCTVPFEL